MSSNVLQGPSTSLVIELGTRPDLATDQAGQAGGVPQVNSGQALADLLEKRDENAEAQINNAKAELAVNVQLREYITKKIQTLQRANEDLRTRQHHS